MYQSLLQSHFLQSLGSAILYSLWQALALLVLYKIILVAYKNLKAAAKHNLSVIFVFATFGWFLLTFFINFFNKEVVTNSTLPIFPVHEATIPNELLSVPMDITSMLSLSYLALLFFFLVRWVFSIKRCHQLKNSGRFPVESDLIKFTLHAASLLKIKRTVSIWISRKIDVPATIGFLKPVILLPAVCITHLSSSQLESIILHELAHIRRNDYLLNMILTVIETILFFNPAVFVLMQIARRERENCCDDIVISNDHDPENYALALFALSKHQYRTQPLAMNAVSNKNQLLQRIRRITGNNFQTTISYPKRIIGLSLLTFILFFVLSLLPKIENHFHNKSKQFVQNIVIKKEGKAPAKPFIGLEITQIKNQITISSSKKLLSKEKKKITQPSEQPSKSILKNKEKSSEKLTVITADVVTIDGPQLKNLTRSIEPAHSLADAFSFSGEKSSLTPGDFDKIKHEIEKSQESLKKNKIILRSDSIFINFNGEFHNVEFFSKNSRNQLRRKISGSGKVLGEQSRNLQDNYRKNKKPNLRIASI